MIRAAFATLMLTAGGAAADAMSLATAAAMADCASEGGVLELDEGAAQMVDLTGDGSADDALVWEYGGFCGPDLGFRGGSGGAPLHVAVGDRVGTFMAGSWTLADVVFASDGETRPPLRVLMLARHGSACDGAGASPCVEAVVWDAGDRLFRTVATPPRADERDAE
ncbi:MAG: hypothetical protein KF887_18835 [Paracoccaceae bacterium]|nr:MAG: hypothetical protein KF887_18835 [Paracoccaceae bacterium]